MVYISDVRILCLSEGTVDVLVMLFPGFDAVSWVGKKLQMVLRLATWADTGPYSLLEVSGFIF